MGVPRSRRVDLDVSYDEIQYSRDLLSAFSLDSGSNIAGELPCYLWREMMKHY